MIFTDKFDKTDDLTPLDKKIINLVFREKSIDEIAMKVDCSSSCVKRRLASMYRMFGVRSKVGLVIEILKIKKAFTI